MSSISEICVIGPDEQVLAIKAQRPAFDALMGEAFPGYKFTLLRARPIDQDEAEIADLMVIPYAGAVLDEWVPYQPLPKLAADLLRDMLEVVSWFAGQRQAALN